MGSLKQSITRLMGRLKHPPAPPADGNERRQCARLIYPPEHRPRFRVRQHDMEVVDISENGLCMFLDDANVGQRVHGELLLGSGGSLEITGEIIWQKGKEVGVLLSHRPPVIPESLIFEEIRWVLRQTGLSDAPAPAAPPET